MVINGTESAMLFDNEGVQVSNDQIQRLCRCLDYRFSDPALLQTALTHSSANENNNQRLEFLGDAVLGLIIGEYLFSTYTDLPEGDLTRFRATLVRRETLAKAARDLGIAAALYLGKGGQRDDVAKHDSILADALEAVVGALYLDAGLECCRDKVLRFMQPYTDLSCLVVRDPKTVLQETLQARKKPLPSYAIESISGKPHACEFTVRCTIAGIDQVVSGRGSSRRRAEQNAAAQALKLLHVNG